ncbi:MAG: hypothetical protein ACFFCS_21915 [Candidatus Hodarchaeota archaeon]
MAEIYIPIDSTNLKDVIPPGEDILYSTMCQGTYAYRTLNQTISVKFNAHALLTTGGIAYTCANRGGQMQNYYEPWWRVFQVVKILKWRGFVINRPDLIGSPMRKLNIVSFSLKQNEGFETEEKFKERNQEFVGKFRPLLIQRRQEWLAANQGNSEVDKKLYKNLSKELEKMMKNEDKRLQKEARKKK